MCSWMSHRKSSLHAIDFTGGWVAYKCYHWSSFFKWLWFIPYSFSNSYEIARLLQNSLRELWFCCVEDFREGLIKIQLIRVLPKQWIKHWLEFSVFPPLTSAHWLEKKTRWQLIQSTTISANCVRVKMYWYECNHWIKRIKT